ncbi:MAG: eukaryotic-like serine/threonine-protein kinase, partial [Frankiaceae bacterium]|nr:eukaryotic-like serine/threonine-protein kinase [Frankiaceae bacterium]
MTVVDAPEPRLLGGRYVVGGPMGPGGRADVHAGHDTRLGRAIAVKILKADLSSDPLFHSRFRREAQSSA